MYKYLLLLLFPVLLYSQNTGNRSIGQTIFASNDTVASITSEDSVYIQFYDSSTEWQLLTSAISDGDTAFVTANDKSSENTVMFDLANESFWTHAPRIRFQVRSTGTDTITSFWINVDHLNGACTLFLKADTSGSNTDYGSSYISGN